MLQTNYPATALTAIRREITTLAETEADFVSASEGLLAIARDAIEDDPELDMLTDMHAQATAIGEYLARKIQSREARLLAQNNIAESRIRIERAIGALIQRLQEAGELETRGGDRKSKSHDVTLIDDVDKPMALADVGISKSQSSRWQAMASLPDDEFEETVANAKESGWELTSHDIQKRAKEHQKAVIQNSVPSGLPDVGERYHLLTGDICEALPTLADGSFDAIITDPPYKREFIPLYETLAIQAARLLVPGGLLIVMCGQSYLPDLLRLMTPHIRYHWTYAYLTPGGQSAQIWPRKVNTFWKPVFVFTNGDYQGDWTGDVLRSDVNDNDKRFHTWGQSESGIADMFARFTKPGQRILDPFLGGGTAALIALKMNRIFTGIDVDPQAIETTKRRIEEWITAK